MRILASACLVLAVSACSASTSSRNIRTAGVVVLIDVTSTREGAASVDTEIVIGGASSNTNVILEGGDTLTARANGKQKVMSVQSSGSYEASFPTSEGEFVVSLARDVDEPAPNNRGKLGPAFDIEVADTKVSRAKDALKLSWTPIDSDASVEVEVEGKCLIRESKSLARDTGSVTFKKGELRAWKKDKKNACDVEVTVTRTRTGTTDPALDRDSRFRLHQVRKASFTSTP